MRLYVNVKTMTCARHAIASRRHHINGMSSTSMPEPPRSTPLRKVLVIIAIVVCLTLATLGGLLPIIPGWIFLVPALYLLATEFESGRRWITSGRRRWPWLSRQIKAASTHQRAPRFARTLDDLTDPGT
jgi:fatty acid desaturase